MRRRDFIAALGFAALAGPALATEHGGGEGESRPTNNYVDVSPVALPIVVGGRLVNYVFVQVRINFAPNAAITSLRAKEPYFRDALVRAAHRTPFTRNDDYTRIDQARLRATLMPLAVAIAGPGAIVSIAVMSETPQRRGGLPRPPGAVAPRTGPAIVP